MRVSGSLAPASVTPNQSSTHCFARATTSSGSASKRTPRPASAIRRVTPAPAVSAPVCAVRSIVVMTAPSVLPSSPSRTRTLAQTHRNPHVGRRTMAVQPLALSPPAAAPATGPHLHAAASTMACDALLYIHARASMFEWDDRNTAHIARHNVTPREAEEAMADPRRRLSRCRRTAVRHHRSHDARTADHGGLHLCGRGSKPALPRDHGA